MNLKRKVSIIMLLVFTIVTIFPLSNAKFALADGAGIVKEDFEGETTGGLVKRGTAKLESSTEVAHSGSKSLKVFERGQVGWDGANVSLKGKLEVGKEYIVSVWMRLPSGSADATFKITMETNDDGGKRFPHLKGAKLNSKEWKQLIGKFTYNPNGTVTTYNVNIESEQDGIGTAVYVDDFYIGPASEVIPDFGVSATVPVINVKPALKTVQVSNGIEITDVIGTEYESAVNLLANLNILKVDSDKTFKPKNKVTRAELTDILMRFIGLDSSAISPSEGSLFTDVTNDYWAYGSITAAVNQKIISGYGNGTFGPEDSITFEQAVKVIVCVLGYNEYAKNQGGYPSGYLAVAANNGILKGIQVGIGTEVNKGILAQMLYNTLDVDILDQVGFGDQSVFNKEKGINILSDKHKIYEENGQIIGNGNTKLNGSSLLKKDEVEIKTGSSSNVFKIGKTNADHLLGYRITFYYKDDTDEKTLLYITLKNNKDDILIINEDDIEDYSMLKYTYWKEPNSDDISVARIADNADVIYNGKAYTASYSDSNIYLPESGNVELIDDNGDGDYDVVKITSFTTMIIGSIDAVNKIVCDKYDPINNVKLDYQDIDQWVSIKDINGKEVKFEDLKEGDVLSYAPTTSDQPGKKVVNCVVANTVVKGKVDEISTGSEDKKIVIAGKEYKISKYFYRLNRPAVEINDSGTFYLDYEGKCVMFITEAVNVTTQKVGYLIRVSQHTKGVEDYLRMKVFGADGNFHVLRTADSVTFDGLKLSDPNSVKTELIRACEQYRNAYQFTSAGNLYIPQIIRYQLDSEGYVSDIDTTLRNLSAEGEYNLQCTSGFGIYNWKVNDPVTFFNNIGYASTATNPSPISIPSSSLSDHGGQIHTAPDTAIFKVPPITRWLRYDDNTVDITFETREDEGNYSVTNIKELTTDTAGAFNLDAYKLNSDAIQADYVTVYASTDISYPREVRAYSHYIVNGKTTVIDENGETRTKLSLYNEKGEASFILSKNCKIDLLPFYQGTTNPVVVIKSLDDLKPGTIIRITKSKNNEITDIFIKQNIVNDTKTNNFGMTTALISNYPEDFYVYGQVYAVRDGYMIVYATHIYNQNLANPVVDSAGNTIITTQYSTSNIELVNQGKNVTGGNLITDRMKNGGRVDYDPLSPNFLTLPLSFKMVFVGKGGTKCRPGTVADLIPYIANSKNFSRVFLRQKDDGFNEMYIYNP